MARSQRDTPHPYWNCKIKSFPAISQAQKDWWVSWKNLQRTHGILSGCFISKNGDQMAELVGLWFDENSAYEIERTALRTGLGVVAFLIIAQHWSKKRERERERERVWVNGKAENIWLLEFQQVLNCRVSPKLKLKPGLARFHFLF